MLPNTAAFTLIWGRIPCITLGLRQGAVTRGKTKFAAVVLNAQPNCPPFTRGIRLLHCEPCLSRQSSARGKADRMQQICECQKSPRPVSLFFLAHPPTLSHARLKCCSTRLRGAVGGWRSQSTLPARVMPSLPHVQALRRLPTTAALPRCR